MRIRTNIHTPFSSDIISEITELSEHCHSEKDVPSVMGQLAKKIAGIMQVDVCSIYLLDASTNELILKATQGLNPQAVDRVRLKMGEGLVGKTMEWLKPVSVAMGHKSKSFKYFPETGEEKYSSFLAVPLIYNRSSIGVLVVQNKKAIRFSSHAIQFLMTLAIPAVNVIEKAKLLGTFGQIGEQGDGGNRQFASTTFSGRRDRTLSCEGIGASPGIVMAPVRFLHKARPSLVMPRTSQPLNVEVEKMIVLEAFRWVEEEIRDIQTKAKKKFGMEELSIFDAYSLVLESEPFKQEILSEIENGNTALKSVNSVISRYTEQLALADDEYIKERTFDIQDVGRKITDRLIYGSELPQTHRHFTEPSILLSDYWSISDFVELDLEKTQGILSPEGGASSHIAILANSLGVPAVLGLSLFAERIHESDFVIMDGTSGIVLVNPTLSVKKAYEREISSDNKAKREYQKFSKKPAIPIQGKKITIGANMGIVSHVNVALGSGAEEIGLYRTEFPFLIRRSLPTEEEQYELYKKILKDMGGRPVTIRTLDIGGDKYIPYLNLPKENNPFLGWRSIRISLEREDLFRIQLRALLRASVHGVLRILFPMISSIEEIRRVKAILKDVRRELSAKQAFKLPKIPIGIMIEVPSAVAIADSLIKEVNFFSIGTNDLIQYTLAVDRNNAKVAKLYDPFHPAVLRAINQTCQVARHEKKPVSVCGEMASNPMAVFVLVGMGIENLSLSAPQIGRIKRLIGRLHFPEVQKVTKNILSMNSSHEIRKTIIAYLKSHGLEEFLPHAAPVV